MEALKVSWITKLLIKIINSYPKSMINSILKELLTGIRDSAEDLGLAKLASGIVAWSAL